LRTNLTFQNGKPLDATAAVAALNRQVAKAKATRVYLEEGSVFTAVDDLHLTLTTPKPNAMVPAALASRDNAFQVYDVAAIEAAAGDSTKIVGQGAFTGPYAITAWTPENLETARYDGYWAGRPALANVTVKVVADEQARIAGVQSGQADLAFYPSPDAKLALHGSSDATFLASEQALQALLIDMNLSAAPFNDVAVRQAFARSIDYAALADQVANGVFDVATGLYPASMPYAVANQSTDVPAAQALLDQAGWTTGADGIRSKDGSRLVVRFVTQAQGPETLALATAMQAQVKKAGFDLQINNAEDSAAVKKDMSAWDASIGLNGSLSGTADPLQPFLSRWTTGGSANAQGALRSGRRCPGRAAQGDVRRVRPQRPAEGGAAHHRRREGVRDRRHLQAVPRDRVPHVEGLPGLQRPRPPAMEHRALIGPGPVVGAAPRGPHPHRRARRVGGQACSSGRSFPSWTATPPASPCSPGASASRPRTRWPNCVTPSAWTSRCRCNICRGWGAH
jgi:ABC-type transport system substrate-binding protein